MASITYLAQGKSKRCRGLTTKLTTVESKLNITSEQLKALERDVHEEIERQCRPMRAEVADTIALLMKERSDKAVERAELADLWPSGWLLPSILLPYKTIDSSEANRFVT
jgi:hypothetical protein